MRVFMLGWEFPPYISGGLGTACYGLTKALSALGTDIIFVLPRPSPAPFISQAPVPQEALPPPEAAAEITSANEQTPAPGEWPHSPAAQRQPAPPPKRRVESRPFQHVTFRTIPAQLTDPYQSAENLHVREVAVTIEQVEVDEPAAGQAPTAAPAPPSPEPFKPLAPTPPGAPQAGQYSGDLFAEVQRYARLATEIARRETFDIVHAHDWMTFPAGMAVAAAKGVPLVVHVHSTEFDRSGIHIDQRIYDIERRGMHAAMRVIAVSFLTKNQITHNYGVEASKVDVIYNAIEIGDEPFDPEKYKIRHDEKIVLFLGRITHQKGPEYFLSAAKKVLEVMDNVKFVMAGSGDLTRQTIDMASQMGIGHKVLFTGFLGGADIDRIFQMADLFVMPSVSEPFGIAPLEAMIHDVPVLISKQSGVSEVLAHALKVDFWDTTEMANKIVAVLRHPPLARTLRRNGSFEVRQLNWSEAAISCMEVYDEALEMMALPKEPGKR